MRYKAKIHRMVCYSRAVSGAVRRREGTGQRMEARMGRAYATNSPSRVRANDSEAELVNQLHERDLLRG